MDEREEEIQLQRIHEGLIPWDIEGFMAAHDFAARLLKTPKDDWDHRRRGVTIDVSDGAPEVQQTVLDALQGLTAAGLTNLSQGPAGHVTADLNSLASENQIALFIRGQSGDRYVGTAHAVRFFKMGSFLDTHKPRLIKEGLLRKTKDPDDPVLGRSEEINEVVLQALCELPYKGRRRQGPSGYAPTFKLSDVIKRAKELLADEEAAGGP